MNIKDFKAEFAKRVKKRANKVKIKSKVKIAKGYEDLFEKVDMGDGDEFMCVLPWKGAIKEPDEHSPLQTEPPQDSYSIQVAYGVRTEDTRENIHFNRKGKVVYMTAALGVINDYQSRKQTFFGGGQVPMEAKNIAKDMNSHTDDILCLNLSNDRKL